MATKKKWADMSPTQRGLVVAGAVAEMVLTTYAAKDLKERPAESVRGPKALWGASFAVQPFGPIAYLVLGRR